MTNGGATVVTANGGQPPNGNLEKRVAAIEVVLPTLATKADLTELRAEMRAGNAELRAEMRMENEKLRADVRIDNEKLRAELSISQDKLRVELSISQDKLRVEMEKLSVSLVKWMIATTLSLLIAFAALFIGLGNMLVSRLTSPDVARASVSVEAHSHAATLTHQAIDLSRLK